MVIKRIELDGPMNTRDMGGLTNKYGRKIKEKMLLRSGELSACSKRDKNILISEYNIKKIVDLRTDVEIEETPNPVWQGIEYFHFPVFNAEVMGITRDGNSLEDMVKAIISKGNDSAKVYMSKIYEQIVASDTAKKAYSNFIKVLAEKDEGAVLWNCSAGKDRTGAAAILVLTILEFEKEKILEDYMKTNEFAESNIAHFAEAAKRLTGIKDTRIAAEYMMGVNKDYFNTLYNYMESEYGSAEGYIKEGLKVDDDIIYFIREKYLM